MPNSKTHPRTQVLPKILATALWLNICAISAILLAEMDTNTILMTLVILILLNTIAIIFALGTIALLLTRMTAQLSLMTDVKTSLGELVKVIEQQTRLLEFIGRKVG